MNAPHDMNGAAQPYVPPVDINLIPGPEGMGPMFGDLATAQGEFKAIEKNKTARISNREGKFLYEFSYADMGEINSKTTPALSKVGIAVVSLPTAREASKGGHVLRTMLCHKSGARIESCLVIPEMRQDGRDKETTVKDFGGYITYLRRYQVSAMLNVAADSDLDASQGDGEDDEGGAPRIGSPAPSQGPANPGEFPPLDAAKTVADLNKAWLPVSAANKLKFQAHYDRRMDELDPPPQVEGKKPDAF